LQVLGSDEPETDHKGAMPCDPDVLVAVLRGITYQLASETGYCAIRRVGPNVSLEYQAGTNRHTCHMSADEYGKLVSPQVPARLRAMLL
jgi:hypothetical protein